MITYMKYKPPPNATLAPMGFCERDARRSSKNEKRESGASIGTSLRWHPALLPYYESGKGSLWVNPLLCEWMMGYPTYWTDLNSLGMDGFRKWLQELLG